MFGILSINSTKNNPVEIKQAEIIGEYSLDVNRKLCTDSKKNLKFLKDYNWNSKSNQVHFDLNEHIEERVEKDKWTIPRINHILQWILLNKEKLYVKTDIIRIFPDFVCSSGRISDILSTPYTDPNFDPWIQDVIKYRGTIYITEIESEKKFLERQSQTERQNQMCAWGFKFENCMLGEAGPINENSEYNCVFKTMMGPHSLLAASEIDAVDFDKYHSSEAKKTSSFIEFKTNKLLSYRNAERTFCRYKPMKWWAQSAIIGIPHIICGFRTEAGIVTETRPFKVDRLPNYNHQKLFDPNVMLNFSLRLFEWLKIVIQKDYPTVYRIEHKENDKITCNISEGDSFISQEYINEMFTT